MRSSALGGLPVLVLLLLSSCAEDPPPPAQAPAAPAPCGSAQECALAQTEAQAHQRDCHKSGTKQYGPLIVNSRREAQAACDRANAELEQVSSRLTVFRQQEREKQVAEERARRDAERQAEQDKRDAERREREERIAAEKQQRENAAWAVVDLKGCAERGNPQACNGLVDFITRYPGSAHQDEAAAALRTGRDVMARAAPAPAPQKAASPESSSPSPPAAAPSGVCCCDGSVSPTCTTAHRGCCSHHGGVCGCR